MEKTIRIAEYFADIKTVKEHNGYFCSVREALIVAILGTLCGLKNVCQISQWSTNERVKGFLAKHTEINFEQTIKQGAVPRSPADSQA